MADVEEQPAARVDAAFQDMQAMHGHQIYSPPPAYSTDPVENTRAYVAAAVQSLARPLQQSCSFEDLHLSVGASTLARDVANMRRQSNHDLVNASNVIRSSSAMSFFNHRNNSTRRHYKALAARSSRNTPFTSHINANQLQTRDLGSAISSFGHMSHFSDQSQVPQPLVISPRTVAQKINPVTSVPLEDIHEGSDERPASSDSRKLTIAEIRTRAGWQSWEPILSPHRESIFLLDDILDEIGPHPAVRVPLRGPDSRRADIVSTTQSMSIATAARARLPGSTPPLTPARRHTDEETYDPFNPPDKGVRAWLQVVGAFLVSFAVWGMILSYGAYIGYYQAVLLPDSGLNTLSLIGSIQVFFVYALGPVLQTALCRGWFRFLFIAGSLLFVAGVFCTSLCTTWWEFFLIQGIFTGIGMSIVYNCATDILTTYFAPNGNLGGALAIAASGSAIGGLAFTGTIQAISSGFDFVWAVRAQGCMVVFNLVVAHVLFRPRTDRQHPRYSLYEAVLRAVDTIESVQAQGRPQRARQTKHQAYLRSVWNKRMVPFWCLAMGLFFSHLAVLNEFYFIVVNGLLVQNLSGNEACSLLLALITPTLPGILLPPLLVFRKRRSRNRLTPNSMRMNPIQSHSLLQDAEQPFGNALGISGLYQPARSPRALGIQALVLARANAKGCLTLLGVLTSCCFIACLATFIRTRISTTTTLIGLGIFYGLSVGPLLGITPPVMNKLCTDFPPAKMRSIMRAIGTSPRRSGESQRRMSVALVKSLILHVFVALAIVFGLFLGGQLISLGLNQPTSTQSFSTRSVLSDRQLLHPDEFSRFSGNAKQDEHYQQDRGQNKAMNGFAYITLYSGISLFLAVLFLGAARLTCGMARYRD